MICVNCGHNVGEDGFCTGCGFVNKQAIAASKTANYFYNIGLEKAEIHDLSGAVIYLKKALQYNKAHKDARNLLGLVYYEMGEGGRAYLEWKRSVKITSVEENIANLYIKQMEEHPAVFEAINEVVKKYNLALSYAKQDSDDLALIQVKKVLSIMPNFVNAHLLFALLRMRSGNEDAAKIDLKNVLAIDRYNTTAHRYLKELGEKNVEVSPTVSVETMRPDNNNLKNVRPVDHYEDPNKETWKQFVYMLVGLAIGVTAMFVLVMPSVKTSVSVNYNKLEKEYKETVAAKDAEIKQLQDDKSTLESKNKKINKKLKVYEGSDGEESMYDSLLKALQAYNDKDYVQCAKYLTNVDKASLPSSDSKELYQKMRDESSSQASSQLYAIGKAAYDSYKYEEALPNLEQAYLYSDHDYEIEYSLAMCYKKLGNQDVAYPLLYDIINNSKNNDLIRKSANYGLELLKDDAIKEAAKHKDADGTLAETTSKKQTSKEN